MKSRLTEPEERARLARVFEQGLDTVVGYALPLARDGSGDNRRWVSGPWFIRPEAMFLIPGDSPMGYRLPLDSLPWAMPPMSSRRPSAIPSPSAVPLPTIAQQRQAYLQNAKRMEAWRGRAAPERGYRPQTSAARPLAQQSTAVARTALCVEPRDGRLHIFMPPLPMAEDYLDLVAAIEDTAETLGTKVMLEGYPPPRDPRLQHFSVTPDPA